MILDTVYDNLFSLYINLYYKLMRPMNLFGLWNQGLGQ